MAVADENSDPDDSSSTIYYCCFGVYWDESSTCKSSSDLSKFKGVIVLVFGFLSTILTSSETRLASFN